MKIYFVDSEWLTTRTLEIEKEEFAKKGHTIEFKNWSTEEEIVKFGKDADVLMVVAVTISSYVIESLPNLKFIGRCGIGYDTVDLEAATGNGVVVCNVPDYCTYEVASHAMSMMMALKRNLIPFINRAKSGGYGQGKNISCTRLEGQTIGLLGYGRIARKLSEMCKGMSMEISAYDPYVNRELFPEITFYDDYEDLLRNADVISIHMPLTPETKHLINYETIKLMKKNALLINTSRGPVVDTKGLIKALNEEIIEGAGLDVCEGEPLRKDDEIFNTRNLIITPHVAMFSEEAMIDLHKKLTKQAIDVLEGRDTVNIVNVDVKKVVSLK